MHSVRRSEICVWVEPLGSNSWLRIVGRARLGRELAALRGDVDVCHQQGFGSDYGCSTADVIGSLGSDAIADRPQQLEPGEDVVVVLHAKRGFAVDDADDAAPARSGCDQHLERIGRGTHDAADLRHLLERIEHVDRVASPQEHDEAVAAGDRQRGFDRRCDQLVVVPGTPDKTWPGRLAERRNAALATTRRAPREDRRSS